MKGLGADVVEGGADQYALRQLQRQAGIWGTGGAVQAVVLVAKQFIIFYAEADRGAGQVEAADGGAASELVTFDGYCRLAGLRVVDKQGVVDHSQWSGVAPGIQGAGFDGENDRIVGIA